MLFSSAVIAGLLLSVAPATVQAASTASNAPKTTNVNPKAVIENDPKLTKQGYVLRIKNSKLVNSNCKWFNDVGANVHMKNNCILLYCGS